MPLTLEEMLNPVEEEEIGESGYRFAGGDAEIVAKVNHEMAVKRGEAVEVDDEVEEAVDEENEPEIKLSEAIHLCEQMERISITYGTCETSLDLTRCIRKLWIELRQRETAGLLQSTLDRYVAAKSTNM
ncbi:hypothetical protein EDC04DRAFT_2602723 [Pisolithus marmoratus]|nr:hypothetical protein EDC04DRAFT_2602723 [Pisolithus marmoratus]